MFTICNLLTSLNLNFFCIYQNVPKSNSATLSWKQAASEVDCLTG
jgi:hypothetical protein